MSDMDHDAAPTRRALAAVRTAPTILEAIRRADDLIDVAAREASPGEVVRLLREALVDASDASDALTAIAAVHALAAVRDSGGAAETLVGLLSDGTSNLREHAAWALGSSPVAPLAIPELETMVSGGGFGGTLAQLTLEAWGVGGGEPLGPVPGGTTTAPPDGVVGSGREGLTVAQVFLHADIDGSLQHAGQGDTGGIATLLVHLGDALLAGDSPIGRVLTISRGGPGDGSAFRGIDEPGHHYLPVPLPGPTVHAADAWPLRVAARRGIRRILLAAGRVDVLHLRMADVGSWAAAEVARELGIPVVLTMAPDPHALIATREAQGSLTRATFGAADLAEHLMFRVRLLRELGDQAAHVVVFPRPDLERDLRELMGIDLQAHSQRISVVPEGIDLAPIEQAVRAVSAAAAAPAAASAPAAADPADLAALDALLHTLPPERRRLPLAVTVGRLHPVKGMATLVEAWDGEPDLRARCNLLVVGGDLRDPSDDEARELARIDAIVARSDAPSRGLLLAGHRPNSTVTNWLAAVRFGRPGLCAPRGAYVSASLKEEFGIAILEAMATGLVVVAPDGGGPATYVDDGVTGVLVDTHSPESLARAVAAALDLAAGPGAEARAEQARTLVSERFSIDTMAAALARIYTEVTSRGAGGAAKEPS